MIANPLKFEYDCFEQGELNEIEAESIGWIPLEDGAYLHVNKEDDLIIEVVGVIDLTMSSMNVLLVG